MDLDQLRQRRFTPTWGDNDKDATPWQILFTPPTVGQFDAYTAACSGEDADSNEAAKAILADCITGHEGLMSGGKSVSGEDAFDFLTANPALFLETFRHVIAEATISRDEGKK